MVATLADEPAPTFVEGVPGANKVVIACVSGLGMAAAEASMVAEVRGVLHEQTTDSGRKVVVVVVVVFAPRLM